MAGDSPYAEFGEELDRCSPAAPSRRARPRLRWPFRAALYAVTLLAVYTVASSGGLRSGYALLVPGPVFDALTAVEGPAPYPAAGEGQLLVTTVEVQELTWPRYVWSRVVDSDHVVPLAAQAFDGGIAAMQQSKLDAAVAGLSLLNIPPTEVLTPLGAALRVVEPGGAADVAGLRPGDVITAAGDTPIRTFDDLVAVSETLVPGTPLAVAYTRDGEESAVELVTGAVLPFGVGGETAWSREPTVDIASGVVQGSSAGLIFALTYVDVFSPGDLTGGRVVAGSGTIDSAGNVGTVDGVPLKIVTAANNGATVMFIPAETAEFDAPDGVQVVRVTTLLDAVGWLCANGSTDAVCQGLG